MENTHQAFLQTSKYTLLDLLRTPQMEPRLTRSSSNQYHSPSTFTSAQQCPRLRLPRWWITPISWYFTSDLLPYSSTLMVSSKLTSRVFFSLSQQPLMKRDRCRIRYLGQVQRQPRFLKLLLALHFSQSRSSITSSPRYSSIMSLSSSGPSEQQQREEEALGEKGRERLLYLSKLYFQCPQGQLYFLSISPQKMDMILLFSIFCISFMKALQFSSIDSFSLQDRSGLPPLTFSEFSLRNWSMSSISSSWLSCCSQPCTISTLFSRASLNLRYSSVPLLFFSEKKRAVSSCLDLEAIGKSLQWMISKSTWRTAEMQQVLVRFYRPRGWEGYVDDMVQVRFCGELRVGRLQELPQEELEVDHILLQGEEGYSRIKRMKASPPFPCPVHIGWIADNSKQSLLVRLQFIDERGLAAFAALPLQAPLLRLVERGHRVAAPRTLPPPRDPEEPLPHPRHPQPHRRGGQLHRGQGLLLRPERPHPAHPQGPQGPALHRGLLRHRGRGRGRVHKLRRDDQARLRAEPELHGGEDVSGPGGEGERGGHEAEQGGVHVDPKGLHLMERDQFCISMMLGKNLAQFLMFMLWPMPFSREEKQSLTSRTSLFSSLNSDCAIFCFTTQLHRLSPPFPLTEFSVRILDAFPRDSRMASHFSAEISSFCLLLSLKLLQILLASLGAASLAKSTWLKILLPFMLAFCCWLRRGVQDSLWWDGISLKVLLCEMSEKRLQTVFLRKGEWIYGSISCFFLLMDWWAAQDRLKELSLGMLALDYLRAGLLECIRIQQDGEACSVSYST